MERKIKFSAYDKYEGRWIYAEGSHELYELFYGDSDGQLKWLRQYTGLTDKNEEEIYEGDIVMPQQGPKDPLVVVYIVGCFILEDSLGGRHDLLSKWLPVKVIGNIFEDPELMEEVN